MAGLSARQVNALLQPINPARVKRDGKGFSHVEQQDDRVYLNRIFGFGQWSEESTSVLVFETERGQGRWDVAYRARCALTLHATGAVYAEEAIGDAQNQPSRADAHDLALKMAESQALKRAAMNLGDQFGLSLYFDGTTEAVVKRTLVNPEPVADPSPPPSAPAGADGSGGEADPGIAPAGPLSSQQLAALLRIVTAADDCLLTGKERTKLFADLRLDANRARVLSVDAVWQGQHMPLYRLLDLAECEPVPA